MKNSQTQTANVFNSLWEESHVYNRESRKGEVLNLFNWTNGKIDEWLRKAINKSEVELLDAGCGTGWGASILLSKINSLKLPVEKVFYTGVDLIDVSKTHSYLSHFVENEDINLEICYDIQQGCMLELIHPNKFDIVYAMGTLHHTPDLEKALRATFGYLKSGGTYISRIINKQKLYALTLTTFFVNTLGNFQNYRNAKKNCKYWHISLKKWVSVLAHELLKFHSSLNCLI